MNKGDLFKYQFDIVPCEEGTFIVHVAVNSGGYASKHYGFSNISDLMRWLQSHAQVQPQKQDQQSLKDRLKDKYQPNTAGAPIALPDLTKKTNSLKRVFGL